MKLQMKMLLAIISLFALLMSLSGYLAYRETAASLESALKDNMGGEANALVRAITDLATTSTLNIERTSQNTAVLSFFQSSKDQPAVDSIVSALQTLERSYPDFDRITLLDAQGKVIATSRPDLSKIGDSFADRDYVQQALSGKTYLTNPFMSRVTNKSILATSAPVRLNGTIVGAVYATIDLENFFNTWVAPITVAERGFAYILDNNGLIIMAKRHDWLLNPSLPSTPLYKRWISSNSEGQESHLDNAGQTAISYHKKEPLTKMIAVIQAEESDVYAGLYSLRTTSIIISLCAMLTGGIAIFLIVRPIVRALHQGVVYAQDIAAGKLDGELRVTRKDELGQLADSLRAIPQALKNILQEYSDLEKNIEQGNIAAEGNADKFSGDFSTLIQGTNAILTRFRTVLDNIPSPVVMLNKELKATYLNISAIELAGPGYEGKTCQQLFGRDDYFSSTCALKKAVESKRKASGETQAHPQGKTIDVSYTAIPLLDGKGNIASVLQLLTDLTEIKTTQRTIIEVASEAMGISRQVAEASKELSAQVGQVSHGTEIQRDRVNSTATAMEEMNATVLEVAKNAGLAREQAETTQQKAKEGSEIVRHVIDAIRQVEGASRELDTNMRELGAQAENIGGVMNVISDIADQTNLLALNAAIEAARAGEAGRGFAVVADEVRKLAEKTMSATSEVGNSITGIQAATTKNIDRVAVAAERAGKATELASTSGEALTEILNLASGNAALITSIAAASEQQSATSEEINHAVEEIHRIAADSSEGMHDAASAVQGLARLSDDLKVLLDRLQ